MSRCYQIDVVCAFGNQFLIDLFQPFNCDRFAVSAAADVVILELVDYKLETEEEASEKKESKSTTKKTTKSKEAVKGEDKPKKTTSKKTSEKKEESKAE